MKELIDKLNYCFLNNGNARHIDYDSAEKILDTFKKDVLTDFFKWLNAYEGLKYTKKGITFYGNEFFKINTKHK